MRTQAIDHFLRMCVSLTAERDRAALLSSILDTAMDLAHCDAGTLYLVETDGLRFCRMVTRSQGVRQGGHDAPITLPPVPMEEQYVCAWSAIHREGINVPDVRTETRFDFTGALRYDALTGYRTKSMLVVPMTDEAGELLGVMQLINAEDAAGATIPFDPDIELLVGAIASQAAICITNMQYHQQISTLLDSLTGALSTAIDERSPYNANHTKNMVRYAERFLDWLDGAGHPFAFGPDKRRAFLMSVWLHDVGKLTVPLEVMDKADRLGPLMADVQERFRVMALLDRLALAEGRLGTDERRARNAERAETLEFLARVNKAGFLPDADLERVQALASRTYLDENGAVCPWLTEKELECLSIRKGTLTAGERAVMESHVTATAKILDSVSFPKNFSDTPRWAAAHHELLNGKGYPRRLGAADIPPEVRLLTILDIFDALTARDRPYKPAMPLEKAVAILRGMAREGSLDGEILELYLESKAWEA